MFQCMLNYTNMIVNIQIVLSSGLDDRLLQFMCQRGHGGAEVPGFNR